MRDECCLSNNHLSHDPDSRHLRANNRRFRWEFGPNIWYDIGIVLKSFWGRLNVFGRHLFVNWCAVVVIAVVECLTLSQTVRTLVYRKPILQCIAIKAVIQRSILSVIKNSSVINQKQSFCAQTNAKRYQCFHTDCSVAGLAICQ